jgi:hypothetical protein
VTDTMDRGQYFERPLTPLEIEERKTTHLKLAGEREENLAEIAGKRSEIRALNIDRKKLDLRAAQILREVRSGKVLEPRQTELPLGPPADPYAMFNENYPKAANTQDLMQALNRALGGPLYMKLDWPTVKAWKPSSGIFEAVAHWARVENAHATHGKRKPTPGITLPARFECPGPLAQALEPKPVKPVKARKKTRARPSRKATTPSP